MARWRLLSGFVGVVNNVSRHEPYTPKRMYLYTQGRHHGHATIRQRSTNLQQSRDSDWKVKYMTIE